VAEGVETERQRRTLIDMGCDELQGGNFGMALPAADAERYFANARKPSLVWDVTP